MDKPISVSLFFDQNKVCGMICKICSGVYFNPTIDECGHIFCSKCFEEHISKEQVCPVTRKPLSKTEGGPVSFVENILNKQTLNCPNNCGWIGIFSELLFHSQNYCEEAQDTCKFEGCQFEDKRRIVEEHAKTCQFRVLQCDRCPESFKHFEQEAHFLVCKHALIDCSNKCGDKVERVLLEEHLQTCPLESVSCYYIDFGCKESLPRKDLPLHLKEAENFHKKSLLTKLSTFENKIKTQFDALKIENHMLGKELEELKKRPSAFPHYKRRETDYYEVKKILNRRKKGFERGFPIVALNQKEYLQVKEQSAKYFGRDSYCYAVVDRPITELPPWKVKFSSLTKYAGVGVVHEERFIRAKKSRGHSSTDNGLIVFSNSGFTWNYEKKEKLTFNMDFEENDWIEFNFDDKKSMLGIQVKGVKKFVPIKDPLLKPLFILMSFNDEAEIHFETN